MRCTHQQQMGSMLRSGKTSNEKHNALWPSILHLIQHFSHGSQTHSSVCACHFSASHVYYLLSLQNGLRHGERLDADVCSSFISLLPRQRNICQFVFVTIFLACDQRCCVSQNMHQKIGWTVPVHTGVFVWCLENEK